MSTTLDFYEKNAKDLIARYDQAELKQLNNVFKKYININDTVLDIGFESGRDMKFIQGITQNVFGLDSCDTFIKNMEENGFQGKVTESILPNINLDGFSFQIDKVDVIVCIAVFMHLSIVDIETSIKNIKDIPKSNGVIVISYSPKRKTTDERHFESLTKSLVTEIFLKQGFVEVESFENYDAFNRDIKWITQIFKYIC